MKANITNTSPVKQNKQITATLSTTSIASMTSDSDVIMQNDTLNLKSYGKFIQLF